MCCLLDGLRVVKIKVLSCELSSSSSSMAPTSDKINELSFDAKCAWKLVKAMLRFVDDDCVCSENFDVKGSSGI